MLGQFSTSLPLFILSGIITGLGLASLLGAPMRYIMLNEARPEDRAAAQGALSIFSSIGLMLGGALVGAVAASAGGGADGYARAFTAIGLVALVLFVLSFGLKGRVEEQATIAATHLAISEQ
jgi:MFS family permease